MTVGSALYSGSVMHRRVRPVIHLLRYRVFWLLLDLREIDQISKSLRLFSRNRFNALSFFDRDYCDGGETPLGAQIQEHLRNADVRADGRILLLSMPRILGYVFNPLSLYFCYDVGDRLKAIVYEVHNTFGERHSYVLPVEGDGTTIDQQCDKAFYVSPFLGMDLRYEFKVTPPGNRLSVVIRGYDSTGVVIVTSLCGSLRPLTDRALLSALITFPFLTLKVIAAIHWHALRLYLKGVKVYDHGLTAAAPSDIRSRKYK